MQVAVDDPQVERAKTFSGADDAQSGERPTTVLDPGRVRQRGDGDEEAITLVELVPAPRREAKLFSGQFAKGVVTAA
jgi:hypothetical protein